MIIMQLHARHYDIYYNNENTNLDLKLIRIYIKRIFVLFNALKAAF